MSEDYFDPESVAWVLDGEALGHLKEAIYTCTEVVIDLEMTGLNEHATRDTPGWNYPARIVLASITLPHEGDSFYERKPTTWVVPLSHPHSPFLGRWVRVMSFIASNIKVAGKPVINQNMKFDSRWIFAHTGVDLAPQIAWCTMQGSHMLDENSSTRLKERAPKVFGVERWDDFDLSTPGAAERVPLFDLGLYAARDTFYAWGLAEFQRKIMFLHPETRDTEPEGPGEVEDARLGKLATWCTMPMVSALTSVEQRGMRLDVSWVHAKIAEHEDEAAQLKEKLVSRYPQAGLDPADASFAPTSHWFRAWTEAACDAGDLRVTAMTPGGQPAWGKSVLLRLARAGSEVADQLLAYRGHVKKLEYLRSWLGFVTPRGFIHTTYNCARVVTGRLSSDSPNIQQVTAELKPAYVPSRRGYVILDFDYSQIELRIAAFISRCEVMLQAFREGKDLHSMLALKILQIGHQHDRARALERGDRQRLAELQKELTLDDVTPPARQAGKSANFGLLYMMQWYGFQQYAETVYGISFTEDEAQMVFQAFYEQWTGIGPWHERTIAKAMATGQVVSPIGRVRRVPGIHDGSDRLELMAQRAAVNSPVQGFGSDLMQIASAWIAGRLPGTTAVPDAYVIGTVHDNIIVEAPQDRWEEVARQVIDRMINVNWVLQKMGCTLDVPLAVEVKAGTRWGLSDVGSMSS